MIKYIPKQKGEKCVWSCDICNDDFLLDRNRATEAIKKKQRKFCSAKCRLKYQKSEGVERLKKWVNINGDSKLKKASGVTTDGYVWIRCIGRHNNQIKLHRYLMEVKLGRKLRSDEIVHHINEDKLDNRIENLEITTISNHNKIHKHLKAEKRNDIWTNQEIKDCLKMDFIEFTKKYPKRTRDAFSTRRYLHKKNK